MIVMIKLSVFFHLTETTHACRPFTQGIYNCYELKIYYDELLWYKHFFF